MSLPLVHQRGSAAVRSGLCILLLGLLPRCLVNAHEADTLHDPMLTSLKALSFEELLGIQIATVHTASKHTQKTTHAPASVSVVTADDISRFGYRTLADALRGVPGLHVTHDRSYSYVGVRGVYRPGDYGGRVLILVDGHRLNDPIYNQSSVGTEFPLDMDLIDRIEVVRGPGHALYGDNAFFAVINVIPKRGATVGGGEASASYGSYDTYTGRFSYGTRTEHGVDLLLSGTLLESGGHQHLFFPEYASTLGGIATRLDEQSVRQAYLSAAYRDFSLSGFVGERSKDNPTGQYGAVFGMEPNFVRDLRWGWDARFARELGDDWNVSARLYLDGYRYEGLGPYETGDPAFPVVVGRDLAEAYYWGTEAELARTFFDHHLLSVGTSVRDDVHLRQLNRDAYDPPVVNVDALGHNQTIGFLVQDEYSVLTNLTLSGAGRYDYFTTFGGTLNPRAAVIYEPTPETTLKFVFAEAFRSPNEYERKYTIAGYLGNPDLRPEELRSYELIWEQGLGLHWRTGLSLFLHDACNFITTTIDGAGNFTFENLDDVRTRGFQVDVEGRWNHGLLTRFSYTSSDVEEHAVGLGSRTPANAPLHLAKAALSVPVYQEKVYASFEVQGMSERHTVRPGQVPGFVTANVTLFSRQLLRNLEASASLYNVFDHRQADPVSPDFRQDFILQDGRTFRLKLTYRF